MPADLPAFEQVLASQDSATAALGQWCGARHIAPDRTIHAQRIGAQDAAIPPPHALTRAAGLPARVPLAYRHVRLSCGDVVLSEAHNWYVPARLTDDMNATLATTDTPFGKVVVALHFTRQRLGQREGRQRPCPAGTILSHSARLVLPSGETLALLIECYTAANIAP